MKNKKITLESVIKNNVEYALIESSFNHKLSTRRLKFINLLMAKNEINVLVEKSYLDFIWKIAESDLQIYEMDRQAISYKDFLLDYMIDKLSF